MHHSIDTFESASKPALITYIADKKSQCRILVCREFLLHLELFKFIAAENDQPFDLGAVVKDSTDESSTKRTSAACDQY
jgi:hypothetical protein